MRPEMVQIRTELEKLDLRVKYTQNQTLPEVDLQGSYGVNGLDGNSGGSIDDAASSAHTRPRRRSRRRSPSPRSPTASCSSPRSGWPLGS